MEKRLNKEELLELIDSLGIDKNEFWILSSGALTIRGIYPDAGDLDIAVTQKGLDELKAKQPEIAGEFAKIIAPIDDQRSNKEYRQTVAMNIFNKFVSDIVGGAK